MFRLPFCPRPSTLLDVLILGLFATLMGDGTHKHKCTCGNVWEHDNSLQFEADDEEFHNAHVCTKCGTHVVEKYYEEPT